VNIGLQIYNALILVVDIVLLHVKVLWCVLEGIYKLIVQPEARDVSKDIVLVSSTQNLVGYH
jgi:all-trans-retinol dehydrogenase (NAD+)